MDINDISRMNEGKQSHPTLISVSGVSQTKPVDFKVVYLNVNEIAEIRRGLDGQQWYLAMNEALRFTAHWPLHLQRIAPLGRLQVKIDSVLIVEW